MLQVGDILVGHYLIEALLGEGGMGAVFRAYDTLKRRNVAIKEFRLGDLPSEADLQIQNEVTRVNPKSAPPLTREEALRQFSREAHLISLLEHPNLPEVYDFIIIGSEAYIVMTMVEGRNLSKVVDENGGPLPEETVIGWLKQILNALAYCHNNGVVHRDLKPQNLLITADGVIYLIDFGIAKALNPAHRTTITRVRLLTPGYAPPEQYSVKGRADPRSDLYSLGAVAYYLVTGNEPTEATDRMASEVLPNPRMINPGLSEQLENFILRCLEMGKERRPTSASEAIELLNFPLETPVPPSQISILQAKPIDPPSPMKIKQSGPPIIGSPAPHSIQIQPVTQKGQEQIVLIDQPTTQSVRTTDPEKENKLTTTSDKNKSEKPGPIVFIALIISLSLIFLMIGISQDGMSRSPNLKVWYTPTIDHLKTTSIRKLTNAESTQKIDIQITTTAAILHKTTMAKILQKTANAEMTIASQQINSAEYWQPCTELGLELNSPVDDMKMVCVPAGDFIMGSPEVSDGIPVHKVFLDAFWMDKTEVTNAQYELCVTEGYCTVPFSKESSTRRDWMSYYGNSSYANYPIINIDWYQANAYCNWAGRNLPTEAQWEKAARGLDQRPYPWGKDSPNYTFLNFANNIGDTVKVGSYPKGISPYGALDMSGNVSEWVADWYGPYRSDDQTNPVGPINGNSRVIRGGAWNLDFPIYLSSYVRMSNSQTKISTTIGFRCALSHP